MPLWNCGIVGFFNRTIAQSHNNQPSRANGKPSRSDTRVRLHCHLERGNVSRRSPGHTPPGSMDLNRPSLTVTRVAMCGRDLGGKRFRRAICSTRRERVRHARRGPARPQKGEGPRQRAGTSYVARGFKPTLECASRAGLKPHTSYLIPHTSYLTPASARLQDSATANPSHGTGYRETR